MNKSLFVFLLLLCKISNAQIRMNAGPYDPHDFFTQGFNPPAGNAYRSANGTPGPMYWQNAASYLIHATLSEKRHITGDFKYFNPKSRSVWGRCLAAPTKNLFDFLRSIATPAINDLMGVSVDQGTAHFKRMAACGGKIFGTTRHIDSGCSPD
jgi:hypothetical protein